MVKVLERARAMTVEREFWSLRYFSVDESINLEHGDIVVLAVFECWEASRRFYKIDITVS